MTRAPNMIYAHCGFHKCMTMYARRMYRRACRAELRFSSGVRHYGHDLGAFYAKADQARIASVSGHAIDLDRFKAIKVVRLVRDPRDMLVSAYHYHKRGAESWCEIRDPHPNGWAEVRGHVPEDFPEAHSMMSYLNAVSEADGLRMEFEFRRHHFASMRDWPRDDPRILTVRYEDILGNEVAAFDAILRFMDFGPLARAAGLSYVRRHASTARKARHDHIRNATSGQWRDVLPEDVVRAVSAEFGDVLERHGYAAS